MKFTYFLSLSVATWGFAVAPELFAQTKPEDNGLTPKTATIYINKDGVNNGKTEAQTVAIANNGNVIVGWEDDGEEIIDLEAVWTIFSPNGDFLTPLTTINSTVFSGGPITSRLLSYFRADGTPTPGATSWGPKIKANLFGDGLGMGATSFQLGDEIPEFAAIQNNAAGDNAGDFPSLQLLTNSGQPTKILPGVDDAYAERDGDIRIGDWDFLSNGNILIVGESRQKDDLVDLYGGDTPATHAIFRILTPAGVEVKGATLVSDTPVQSEIWHGSGVISNGFAIRTAVGGRGVIRLFKNDGTAASTNIDLGVITGDEINSKGGSGQAVGFHGNGKDAYVFAAGGSEGADLPFAIRVSVLNADGTVRYSKNASDDLVLGKPGQADAAIDDTGRVLVVYDAEIPVDDGSGTVTNPQIVMGRLFDPAGNPMGGTFYVSENEPPAAATLSGELPRVSLRNGIAAVTWHSLNGGTTNATAALRLFSIASPTNSSGSHLSITRADATSFQLTWTGGVGPFQVQRKGLLSDPQWTNVTTTASNSAVIPNTGKTGFFRIMNNASANP